jgi:hypothetical protein
MIDPYLLLTPILLLGVIALVGFVGCDLFFPLVDPPPPDPPVNLRAVAGDAKVTLTWEDYPDATEFHVLRGTSTGTQPEDYPDPHTVLPSEIPYTDQPLTNGTTFFYRVTALVGALESKVSNEATATPLNSFVLAKTLGTSRVNLTGLAGMAIRVAASPLTIKTLGRIVDSGHAGTHVVSIVNPVNSQSLGSVVVDVAAGNVGEFVYSALASPVTLPAGANVFIVSQETAGVEFHDANTTTVQTTNVARVDSGVFSDGANPFTIVSTTGHTFGPVDFQY